MKQLHKPHLWSWSLFNEERNLDFHSVFWGRPGRNVVIDPLPLSEHDAAHVARLGGVQDIILTNSDHARAATQLLEWLQRHGSRSVDIGAVGDIGAGVVGGATGGGAAGAAVRIWGPALEPAFLAAVHAQPLRAEHALGAELEVIELHGSKTPGELCLLLEGDTLVTGDLIRGQRAGRLNLLPDAKLADRALAIRSLERLAQRKQIEAVLVGDGWPIFRAGAAALDELLHDLEREVRPASAG